jgi:peptidoglycan/xylan/chitin deacetylase (PgdA/CDA1 family)
MFPVKKGYLVLCYHQIVSDGNAGLALAPQNKISISCFRRQLTYFKDKADFISLKELTRRLQTGRPPDRLYVTVTFDDGYGNVRQGLELMAPLGAPATVFLTTGFLDQRGLRPWWDELEDFVLNYHGPVALNLPGFTGGYDLQALRQKRDFFNGCSQYIHRHYQFRDDILDSLRKKWAPASRQDNSWLRWKEVRDLHRAGVTFGAHSVTHPLLTQLSRDAALAEAEHSKRRIEEELDQEVTAFAIPYGHTGAFNEVLSQDLARLGFLTLCTLLPGFNASLDPLRIERACPWDGEENQAFMARVNAAALALRLRRVLGGGNAQD